jgi:hypothetical protein
MKTPPDPSEKIVGTSLFLGMLILAALPVDKGREHYRKFVKLTNEIAAKKEI